jgi:ferritin-like metal-binding protein YciE
MKTSSKKKAPMNSSKRMSTNGSANSGSGELQKLLEDQLADIYYAEKKLLKALPKMAKATEHEELRQAFTEHAMQTEQHIARVEEAFEALGKKAKSKKCEAMDGLLEEANGIKDEFEESMALDAALIAAAQKVEHYEIASYGSMVAWCNQLGLEEVGNLLQQNLDEEKQTDENLTSIAENYVNEEAE